MTTLITERCTGRLPVYLGGLISESNRCQKRAEDLEQQNGIQTTFETTIPTKYVK